jgi:hypothetical protein
MKLPKIESLIIIAFFGIVALWAISKCSSKRSDLSRRNRDSETELEDRPTRRDSAATSPAHTAPAPAPAQTTAPVTAAPATQTPLNTQKPSTLPATAPAQATPTLPPGQRPVLGAPPPVQTAPKTAAPAQSAESKYSTLYVTIDGLKMRKEPNLKGAVVTKLELYEPVYFLNQKTEKIEEISLGYEKVKDHWVKIRTKSGKEGWVFGAGVHYYKMKRKGVMD